MSKLLSTSTSENGAYAERLETEDGAINRLKKRVSCCPPMRKYTEKRARNFARSVLELESEFSGISGLDLEEELKCLKLRLRQDPKDSVDLARCFALIREMAGRTIGQKHRESQLMGGWVLYHGWVTELDTGEGKTLMATLAAATASIAGVKVHVITVNDYLAQRDAHWMEPIYNSMGLSVGLIEHSMEKSERQQAYRCDITYCSNKEVAFDYLRDQITLGSINSRLQLNLEELSGNFQRDQSLLLQGLEYAIIDEADSVLVDEACVPLILSHPKKEFRERHSYELAFGLIESLCETIDYVKLKNEKRVRLTKNGKKHIEDLLTELGSNCGEWKQKRWREEMVIQCLSANEFYLKDRDYLVRDQHIEIIDENTGRTMPDRTWSHGLHQAIEVKEKCSFSKDHFPLAKISYQRFYRKYLHLSGMTGTANEVRSELLSVYGLGVLRIPPHVPASRENFGVDILSNSEEQLKEIEKSVRDKIQNGRSVLIGTRTVFDSDRISHWLSNVGLKNQVLNARNDREEAFIISNAGQVGQITVATNMAGRGTDIRLSSTVRKNGGLHVIATDYHEERRIDRQLLGRCSRQGDPGSFQAIVSIENDLLQKSKSKFSLILRHLLFFFSQKRCPSWFGKWVFKSAQLSSENQSRKQRKSLLLGQDYIDVSLAFTSKHK